tara:strand:- start:4221 stop:5558 length:1338 start_codon:yes stop_codon:yes gene_type:complete
VELLYPGFCAALILVGIHAYLGMHVLARGVIFVDLAMAQAAAFGTLMGFLFYHTGPEHTISYLFSLGFTLLAATFFAVGRAHYQKIPEEAIIGLTYAILSASAILLMQFAPHGAEHIRDMLAGQVLWVTWPTVFKTAVIYSLVGLIHFRWRHQFLAVSRDPKLARERGFHVAFWDFLFYATFGFIITSSVAIGGVLLVFTLLVGPALLGTAFGKNFGQGLLIAYVFGFAITAAGFLTSYKLDYPTGATVVALFGVVLLPIAIWRYIRGGQRPLRRVVGVSITLLVLGSVFSLAWFARPDHAPHDHADHQYTKPRARVPVALHTGDDHEHTHANTKKHEHDGHKHEDGHKEDDTPQKDTIDTLEARANKGDKRARQALIEILSGRREEPFLTRQKAFYALCRVSKGALPSCPYSGNIMLMGQWLQARGEAFQKHYRPATSQPASKK